MRVGQWLLCIAASLLVLFGLWCLSDLVRRIAYALALFALAVAFAVTS